MGISSRCHLVWYKFFITHQKVLFPQWQWVFIRRREHVTLHKPSMFFMLKNWQIKLLIFLRLRLKASKIQRRRRKMQPTRTNKRLKENIFWSPSFLIFLLFFSFSPSSCAKFSFDCLFLIFTLCAVYRIVTSTCLIYTFDFFSLDLFLLFFKPFTQHSSPFLLSRRSPTFFFFLVCFSLCYSRRRHNGGFQEKKNRLFCCFLIATEVKKFDEENKLNASLGLKELNWQKQD